mmetsp:Transcript_591/g.1613  ORF Transcript_591/g.1613 Transcript_591/m.1613 type:complete len:142 (+) Transcript_591:102-527(+)
MAPLRLVACLLALLGQAAHAKRSSEAEGDLRSGSSEGGGAVVSGRCPWKGNYRTRATATECDLIEQGAGCPENSVCRVYKGVGCCLCNPGFRRGKFRDSALCFEDPRVAAKMHPESGTLDDQESDTTSASQAADGESSASA